MVIHQGPMLGSKMELGATGFWNNTMRPSIYYLKNKSGYFDATRAEIVGDIDGTCDTYKHISSFKKIKY